MASPPKELLHSSFPCHLLPNRWRGKALHRNRCSQKRLYLSRSHGSSRMTTSVKPGFQFLCIRSDKMRSQCSRSSSPRFHFGAFLCETELQQLPPESAETRKQSRYHLPDPRSRNIHIDYGNNSSDNRTTADNGRPARSRYRRYSATDPQSHISTAIHFSFFLLPVTPLPSPEPSSASAFVPALHKPV